MQRALTAALGAATIAIPTADAVAAVNQAGAATVTKKTVVTKKVSGSAVEADRWGTVTVTVTVKKTTVITNGVKKVTRVWTNIGGSFTYHTDRSLYIMQQALPQLRAQALQSHSANVDTISHATNTSDAFRQSLQEALAKVKTV
jgi:uncharacterized protein with FMN-binding domain